MASKVEKYPRGTQVFNTRVSSFYFFLRVLLSRVLFFPSSSSFFDAVDLKTRSSNCPPNVESSNQPDRLTQCSIIQSTISSLRSSFVLRSSRSCLFRFVLPLFFFRSFFLYSSLDMMFFKYKNRVLET